MAMLPMAVISDWVILVVLILALWLIVVVWSAPFGKRKCPHCAEMVKKDASVCKHCGRDLSTD